MTPIARSRRGSRSAAAAGARGERAQQEGGDAGRVQQRLVAARQRWPNALALAGGAPLRGGGDGAGVGREPDEPGVAAVALADELAEVQLAAPGHLGGTRVADVRVVLPDDHAARPAVAVEMGDELVERVRHVTVAQVPGRRVAGEHRPVVLLGVGDDGRVLLGEEVVVLGHGAVARQVLAGPPAQLDELLDDPAPAGLARALQHRMPVLAVPARERLQALVAPPGAAGRRRGRARRGSGRPRPSTRRGCRGPGRRTPPCGRARAAARCGRAASRRSSGRPRCATSRSGTGGTRAAPPRRRRRPRRRARSGRLGGHRASRPRRPPP